MKRIIAFVLAVLTVAVVIAGCTTNKNNNTTNNTTTEAKSTTTGKQTTTQTTTEKKDPVTPTVKKAFEGEIGDVLDKIVEKAKVGGVKLDPLSRYYIKNTEKHEQPQRDYGGYRNRYSGN